MSIAIVIAAIAVVVLVVFIFGKVLGVAIDIVLSFIFATIVGEWVETNFGVDLYVPILGLIFGGIELLKYNIRVSKGATNGRNK